MNIARPTPTATALAAWQAYGKWSESPRIDIGWRDYVRSGGKSLYIGKRANRG